MSKGPAMDVTGVTVGEPDAAFEDWAGLLALIGRAFAAMDGVIDPPSSAGALTADALRAKAAAERVFVARAQGRVVGCVFAARTEDALHLSKLAVEPAWQRRGVGRALIAAAEERARALGATTLEVQTRVELVENQAAFQRLGFAETGRGRHAGFARDTFVTMRKRLSNGEARQGRGPGRATAAPRD